MHIGPFKREIIVEPIENPIRRRESEPEREVTPATPTKERERELIPA